jgi:hypothetical protein
LSILQDDCGVISVKWLPYNTIVIPLAAVLAKLPVTRGPAAAANRHKLVRWFWCSVFGQAYENAPNSQAAKDVTELLDWMHGGKAPDTVSGFRFDPRMLRDTTPRQRAVYRGTIALVLSREPRDFYNGAKLTGDLMIEHNVDDHHIFPVAYLDKQGVASRLRDSVVNRTLIDRKTNIRISDRAPATYMQEIQQALGPSNFQQLLESHLLPSNADSPLWTNDFETFLEWRQQAIWQQIVHVTGVAEAVDMLDETAA